MKAEGNALRFARAPGLADTHHPRSCPCAAGSWRKGCQKAGVTDLTLHDLRGTAVTRLAKAGCTVPEIATVTGHSLKDMGTILDSHHQNRDSALGGSAIRKLERGTKTPH